MTENEMIKRIREQACNDRFLAIHCDDSCLYGAEKCEWAHAIQALEEIQQYREIGTVEELQELKGVITDFPLDCGDTVTTVKEILHQLSEYLKIGTIEEFKALKDKAEPKKVKGISLTHEGRVGNCPACGRLVRHQEQTVYCSCEQKLDWSEE